MSEQHEQREQSAPPNDNIESVPYSTACRARAVGNIAEFAECLTKQSDACNHSVPFGESHFCWHPQHREIVQRTSQSEPLGH